MVAEPLVWTGIGVLAAGTYAGIYRGVRAPGLWRTFLKTYVPPERHGNRRLRFAFLCYNVALFLWLFRIWAWMAEVAFHAVPEKDLVELTNGVLGVVYLTAIVGAVIFIPYVRDRIDQTEGGDSP